MTILLAARRALWGLPACCPLDEDLHADEEQDLQFCLTTGADKVCQPKPDTAHLCVRPGNCEIVRTSSIILFQEVEQIPDGKLAAVPDTLSQEPERACAGADGYMHLGSCHSETSAMVLCSPACSS